jgi:hypothetical protein
MVLQFVPRLEDRCMHLLHGISKLDAEPAQYIPLPRIVLGVDLRLDLFIINYADSKRALSVRVIERRSSLLDLGKQLLPIGQRVTQSIEDIFRLQVPQRLKLEPFSHIVFHLLDLGLDQCERSFERPVAKASELRG